MIGWGGKNDMKRKNRILIVLNCVTLALHSILLFAVTTFPVFALSAGGIQTTIASVILSLLLQSGAAPVNSAWVNTLNASYGIESSIGTIENAIQSGLLTETATGLEIPDCPVHWRSIQVRITNRSS